MGIRKKFESQSDIREWIRDNKTTLSRLYFDKNLTARKVAENQNIEFDRRFSKVLAEELGKKGMGLGGSRQGSGNKKGIKFCGKCRKKPIDCICNN